MNLFQKTINMKLIKYALLGMLVFLSSTAIAQDNNKIPKIDELHALKWQSLSTRAKLTPKEIEIVKPVFMEYEQSVWKMHQEKHEFFKSALKDVKTVKPNYADLNDRYVDYELKEAQMFKSYHLQLRKLLQPETLFKYYKAEREFKRKLLKDLQDQHKPGNKQ
jgi:hypothetical protein